MWKPFLSYKVPGNCKVLLWRYRCFISISAMNGGKHRRWRQASPPPPTFIFGEPTSVTVFRPLYSVLFSKTIDAVVVKGEKRGIGKHFDTVWLLGKHVYNIFTLIRSSLSGKAGSRHGEQCREPRPIELALIVWSSLEVSCKWSSTYGSGVFLELLL